jgi:hypothetical protein
MNEQIVTEVRRVLAKHGRRTTAWEFREIVETAQVFIDEAMKLEEAVESAALLVLRLYAIEDPPWSERTTEPEAGSSVLANSGRSGR